MTTTCSGVALMISLLMLTPGKVTPTPLAEQAARPPAPAPRAAAQVATHATKGTVKSVNATAIVITRRTAGKRVDTSFVMTPETQQAGTVAAGVTVEVRYRTDGRQRIATAVSVEAPPQ